MHLKKTLLSLSFLLLILPSAGMAAPQGTSASSVVLLNGTGIQWREARRIIELYGGHVTVVLPPDVLIGEIPEAALAGLQQAAASADVVGRAAAAPPALKVVRTRADAETLLGSPGVARDGSPEQVLSSEAQAALQLLLPDKAALDPARFRVLPGGLIEEKPMNEWEAPPIHPPTPDPNNAFVANAIGNSFNNTSGFLAGDVAVGILRPESTGSASGDSINTETWTAGEVTDTLAQVTKALARLNNDSPRGNLTFVVRTETFGSGVSGTVDCDYEAITFINFHASPLLNVLGKLGYTQASTYNRMREWANDLRSDLGTDWAFGIIIIDNSSDTSNGRASAYVNGPAMWVFQSNTYPTIHHEAGHIWGADDEYHPDAAQSPISLWGYTQVPNANSQYNNGLGYFGGAGEGVLALQIDNIDYVSPWGRGAWGIWDLDGDGINDTQDTFPRVTLNAPSGTAQLTYTGAANTAPLKRETGTYVDADVTINKIVAVEWRLNGGPFQDATATDGTFNASTENFTFTTPTLRNGPYVIEVRARDNFGNVTLVYPRRTDSVSGSATVNNAPMVALSLSPLLGSASTNYVLSAAGSRDYEDSASLQYRWDYENDGTFDTAYSASSSTTHVYGSAGAKTAKVEVKDQGGALTTRTVTFTVAASNLAPTPTFTVDKGVVFSASPAVFGFDASSVVDGEDAASAVQVRWDFEDDGVWDTAYSTTKTASKDYAQTLPISASNETVNAVLYTSHNLNAYAQSFVSTSGSVGKVALLLPLVADTTPGGTCTVGIQSSLPGAFLSSVTQDQDSMKYNDWAVFDVPDITVTNGGTYYLVVVCSDTDIMWFASTANPYAAGQHYYSSNGGTSWNTNAAYDHVFRVYGSSVTTVPVTKSQAIRVRMEAKDTNGQIAQTVRDIWVNGYDTPPTVSLLSSALTGTTSTTFNLTATGADANLGTTWDGLLHYRWDTDGDGNFETEFDTASTSNASYSQPGVYTATVEVRDRYYATARATVQITVAPVTGATQIAVQSGENQSASINAVVTTAPAVIVKDGSNNPVSGVVVVYSVLSGNGVVTAATQTTDGSGIATLGSWTLGPTVGAYTLSVNMPAFPQVPSLTFHATAVGIVATTTTLVSSLNPSSFGQSVTLTATVSPVGATGNVTFKEGATTLGVAALSSGGTAGLAITTLTQGTHTIAATYAGDSIYLTSTSSDLSQLVNPAAPTINDLLANSSGISPAVASYYGGAFTLTVRGANFVDGAVVVGYTTTFVSSTQLTAAIPSSALAALGTLSMKVRNPDNQESNTLSLKVIVRGDNNGNSSVNIGDALVCALLAGGINKPVLTSSVGDVNLNGAVNIGDCLVLALFTGQISANLPVPLISSVSPATAVRGNTLTLTGSGFSATASENQVLFTTTTGVTRVTPSSSSLTSLVVTVPNTATSGPLQAYRMDVPLGGAEFPLPVSGEATPLVLTSVSPFFKVAAGASLTLTGMGFDAVPANNAVSFKSAIGPIGATVTSASTTSLTVTVPTGSICGPVTVTVGAQPSNARTVTVAGSTCAIQLSDMWGGGSPGETVVLEGAGFDIATPGNNIVKFAANGGGTVNAAVLMAGATQLHVRIPATAVQGNVTVTVGANTSTALTWTP